MKKNPFQLTIITILGIVVFMGVLTSAGWTVTSHENTDVKVIDICSVSEEYKDINITRVSVEVLKERN